MGFDVSGNDLELWHVQLPTGVVTMTLDELDAAFQDGKIDERTMVLKSGGLHWMTLADVAGLEESATPPPVSVSPYSQPYSQAPYSQAPYSQAPYSQQYSQPYGEEPQPNSIAPIAIDMSRPSALSIPPLPPVNFDVSFGTEERAVFKPKRNVGAVVGMLAAVAIVAGGLVAVKSMGTEGLKAKVASIVKGGANAGDARAVAIAPPPAAADPPPAFNPTAPPMNNAKAAPIDAPPPAAAAPSANADKNAAKGKNGKDSSSKKTKSGGAPAKKAGGGAGTGAAKQSGSSDPTQKGSGQFDPLNGNI